MLTCSVSAHYNPAVNRMLLPDRIVKHVVCGLQREEVKKVKCLLSTPRKLIGIVEA